MDLLPVGGYRLFRDMLRNYIAKITTSPSTIVSSVVGVSSCLELALIVEVLILTVMLQILFRLKKYSSVITIYLPT